LRIWLASSPAACDRGIPASSNNVADIAKASPKKVRLNRDIAILRSLLCIHPRIRAVYQRPTDQPVSTK
jgi:hypothetical protein